MEAGFASAKLTQQTKADLVNESRLGKQEPM